MIDLETGQLSESQTRGVKQFNHGQVSASQRIRWVDLQKRGDLVDIEGGWQSRASLGSPHIRGGVADHDPFAEEEMIEPPN